MCIRDRQSTGSQQVSMADNKPERLSQHDRIERLVECIQETDAKFDPELEPAVEEDVWFFAPGTTFSSAMTLANSAIGAGILSFPYAFKAAGVAAGIVVTFTLCLLMGGALNIIARCCAARPELKSYGDIVRFYLEGQYGKRAILVFDALMIFYVFGACVGYLMILYDMGHPVLQRIWEIETVGTFFKAVLYPDGFLETTLSRAIIIGFPATCFVLPLSALRDITKLGPSSTFAIVAVCYLGAVVITKSAQHISDAGFPTNDVEWFHSPTGIAVAIPLTCFAFQCQIQVPPIYAGLRPGIRSISTFNKVAIAAYSLCIVLYVPVGCFGYFQFLSDTPHDILEKSGDGAGYPLDDTEVLVARVAIMCSSIGAYPLNHFPAREAFYKFLSAKTPEDQLEPMMGSADKLAPMSNR
eukprot:TRINITY_DN9014_c0_g1_i4.p1 TRINITY_DN9014_c0_g1~~TRINITY_DN9014_c0_g1_i4.p1  ORF type:complete len:412 (+),score=94.69 TRINITY_DN9014_c0_g1_i4:137-1372(+)